MRRNSSADLAFDCEGYPVEAYVEYEIATGRYGEDADGKRWELECEINVKKFEIVIDEGLIKIEECPKVFVVLVDELIKVVDNEIGGITQYIVRGI